MRTPPKTTHLPILAEPQTPEEHVWAYKQGDEKYKSRAMRTLTPLVHAEYTKKYGDDVDAALFATSTFLNDIKTHLGSYTDPRVRLSVWVASVCRQKPAETPIAAILVPDVTFDAKQCPYKVGRKVCDAVNKTSGKRLKIAPCGACNMPEVAESFARESSAEALDLLDSLQMPLAFVRTAAPTVDISTHCPVLNTDLVENCALTRCSFHVDYPWARNCALAYSHVHETNMKPTEIAVLLNLPVSRVEKSLNEALAAMRVAALLRAYDVGDLSRDFEEVDHPYVCCVCESWVDTPIRKEGFTYCSRPCIIRRGPAYARIERTFGNTYRAVIIHAINRFSTKEEAYSALGLTYDERALDALEPAQLKKRTGVRPSWLGSLEQAVKLRVRRLDRLGS